MTSLSNVAAFIKQIIYNAAASIPILNKCHKLVEKDDLASYIVQRLSEEGLSTIHQYDHYLKKNYFFFGINLSLFSEDARLILCKAISSQLPDSSANELIWAIESTPHHALTYHKWLAIYELLCFTGYYTAALCCRIKATTECCDLSPSLKRASQKRLNAFLAASIEKTNSDTLTATINQINCFLEDAEKRRIWCDYANLLTESSFKRICSESEDVSFSSYLRGKSIAIVGPADVNTSSAHEIDSFDIVIRMNYSYTGKNLDSNSKGTKVDISSFNGCQIEALLADQGGRLPSDLKYCLIKCPEHYPLLRKANPNIPIRVHKTFYDKQFHGSFNLLTIILLDLAQYECSSIKVFHCDLMLTVLRQKGYYPSSFKQHNCKTQQMISEYKKGSVIHDPFQQYVITEKLWKSGKVYGDETFTAVMQLGVDKYMSALEDAYRV